VILKVLAASAVDQTPLALLGPPPALAPAAPQPPHVTLVTSLVTLKSLPDGTTKWNTEWMSKLRPGRSLVTCDVP